MFTEEKYLEFINSLVPDDKKRDKRFSELTPIIISIFNAQESLSKIAEIIKKSCYKDADIDMDKFNSSVSALYYESRWMGEAVEKRIHDDHLLPNALECDRIHMQLGMIGELGEIIEAPSDLNERGDFMFYFTRDCNISGFSISDARLSNFKKLSGYYPDGFSIEAAKQRGKSNE